MWGFKPGTRLNAVVVMACLNVPSAALAQGETAFPLLAYQPNPLGSALNAPPTPDHAAAVALQDNQEYQRHYFIGAALGAILGASIGYVSGSTDDSGTSRGQSALIGAAVGAGVGLVVGYFIKTPKDPESALGEVLPTTLALIPSDEGTGILVGWSRSW